MNATIINNAAVAPSAAAVPMQIVLTFDERAMADAARTLLNSFLKRWATEIDVHRDEWSFAELEHPQCRAEALDLARHCDFFIIATTGIADLPASFIDWLEDWAESRSQMETALIVLIASGGANISDLPRCASLPVLARRHGLDFFTTVVTPSGSTLRPSLQPKTLLARLAVLNTDLLPDFSGINE